MTDCPPPNSPQSHDAAYTRKHSGWPFTEENLIGEFIELPRAEHERMLAEIERYRAALERIYQQGRGPHVPIAREALDAS